MLNPSGSIACGGHTTPRFQRYGIPPLVVHTPVAGFDTYTYILTQHFTFVIYLSTNMTR